jgi:hypothetical protein
MKAEDLTGQKFGRLTVVGFAGVVKKRRSWECVCDCGGIIVTAASRLKNGYCKSCGCLKSEADSIRFAKHRKRFSREYNTWTHMKQRCFNPKNAAYKDYGERGITVCKRWIDSFEDFLSDVGEAPGKEYMIDRIDNNGNYEPGNVRWALSSTQNSNKRNNIIITYKGESKTLAQWCLQFGIDRNTVKYRLKSNWPTECLFENNEL